MSKYQPENLLPALRLFVEARNRALELDFTDNGGAIHSVERILDILSQRVKYPHLRHIQNLKTCADAELSVEAYKARERGEPLLIEHVAPQRAFARQVIEMISNGATDPQVISFIEESYRLVLLTREETVRLNRQNRSQIAKDRLGDAGIEIYRADS